MKNGGEWNVSTTLLSYLGLATRVIVYKISCLVWAELGWTRTSSGHDRIQVWRVYSASQGIWGYCSVGQVDRKGKLPGVLSQGSNQKPHPAHLPQGSVSV